MDLDLTDRVVIVTGGSSGIGYAIARTFSQEHARVVINARGRDRLEQAAAALTAEAGKSVLGIPADTTAQPQVDSLVEAAYARYGRVDVLVNCAASPSGLVRNQIEEMDGAALLDDLNTKAVGYARCCRAVAPYMKRRGWGRIINIGGLTGRGSSALSGMRNVAVCHLTKTLSDQLGPHGITVNSLHPGVVRTPHLDELFASEAKKRGCSPAEVEASYVAETPVRRILTAEEVAGAVAFLASPHAAAITGESIGIDGGITRGIYL